MRAGQSHPAVTALGLALESQLRANGSGGGGAAASANRSNSWNESLIDPTRVPHPDSLAGMVVIAWVGITPKVTGKFRVNMTIQTSINHDAAAQSVQASIGHAATPPDQGVTLLTADAQGPIVHVAINGSASISQELVYGEGPLESRTSAGPFPLGTPVFFCALLTQSVANAFGVDAEAGQIDVEEIIN